LQIEFRSILTTGSCHVGTLRALLFGLISLHLRAGHAEAALHLARQLAKTDLGAVPERARPSRARTGSLTSENLYVRQGAVPVVGLGDAG